jgi:hypothetical protein
MERIQGKTFEGKTIKLDGKEFVSCKFHNCELVYSGTGSVGLKDSAITSCRFTLEGAAEENVRLVRGLHQASAAVSVSFPEFLSSYVFTHGLVDEAPDTFEKSSASF